MAKSDSIRYIEVTPENVDIHGVYCIKDKKAPGYKAKLDWFKNKMNEGLKIIIAVGEDQKQQGFIEYTPSEKAWRPINAPNFTFIQCVVVFSKNVRSQGLASKMIEISEEEAKNSGKDGICTMTSNGPWIANKSLFEKNGFQAGESLGRFQVYYKTFREDVQAPKLKDWESQLSEYKGWHLLYADQCPWHPKVVDELKTIAMDHGIDLNVWKLSSPEEAQNAPSGFGTFALIHNGKLLEDHYISKTRFKTIIKKEMA